MMINYRNKLSIAILLVLKISSSYEAFVPTTTLKLPYNCKRGAVKDDPRTINRSLCVRGGGGVPSAGPLQVVGFVGDIATAGITGGIGDYIAQLYEAPKSTSTPGAEAPNKSKFVFDYRRTIAYGTFAGVYTGGFQHLWFSRLCQKYPNPTVQLAINQGLAIPLLYYPILLWMVPKMRARSVQEKIALRKNIDVKAMIPKNWAFWLPLQFIQFRFVPVKFQIAYCSICGLIWKVILSVLTAGSASNADKNE